MRVAIGRAGVILTLAGWLLAIGGAAAQPPAGQPPSSATFGWPSVSASLGWPLTVTTLGPPLQPTGSPLDIELGMVSPSFDTLFRVESGPEYLERLRKEALQQNIKLVFPPDSRPAPPPALAIERLLPARQSICPFVPVCHHPLYFEDLMTERYGWYVPYLQPAVSAGEFWLDTLLLPGKMVMHPPWEWQCDPLWPAPGDAVPFSWPGCH